MRQGVDLGPRIDVDERVAAVGVEVRERQHVVLHVGAAEDLVGLERELGSQVALGKLQVAAHADLAHREDRAFVDGHRDDDRIAVAADRGVAYMHLQVAVVVVERGHAVDVILQLGAVECAGVEEAAQNIMFARLHQPSQPAVREGLVADELDRADLDQRPLTHVEHADCGVARSGHGAKGDLGVEIAFALVDAAQGLNARLHELRILDHARMQFDCAHHLVGGGFYFAHAFGADVGYQRPFLDVVGENGLVALPLDRGVDVGEKTHSIDGFDVVIDDRVVERLAGLSGEMNPDRVLFDALITDDPDARDGRLRLRSRALCRKHQRQK